MGKTIKILILILVVTAGVLILFAYMGQNENVIMSGNPYGVPSSGPVSDQSAGSRGNDISAQDKAALFPFPGPNASAEERKKHADLVMKLAQQVDELFIGGCKPSPFVMGVSLKKDFTIRNSDSVPHRILFQSIQLDVPANGSLVVHPSKVFDKGQGDYGYYCDSSSARGIFYVAL